MSSHRLVSASALAAAAAVLLLAGCATSTPGGSSGHSRSGVATLETSSPSASASTSSDATAADLMKKYGAAPRLRLDMSQADQDRAYQPFNTCVADHSHPTATGGAATSGGAPTAASPEESKLDTEAQALCRPLEPQPPWEYDRDNPDAQRFVEAVIDCLKTKGIPDATIAPDDGSGRISVAFNSKVGAALAAYPGCERQASEHR